MRWRVRCHVISCCLINIMPKTLELTHVIFSFYYRVLLKPQLEKKPSIICDRCNEGISNDKGYHCLSCVDFDLCENCYSGGHEHYMTAISSGIGIIQYLQSYQLSAVNFPKTAWQYYRQPPKEPVWIMLSFGRCNQVYLPLSDHLKQWLLYSRSKKRERVRTTKIRTSKFKKNIEKSSKHQNIESVFLVDHYYNITTLKVSF